MSDAKALSISWIPLRSFSAYSCSGSSVSSSSSFAISSKTTVRAPRPISLRAKETWISDVPS